MSPKQIGVSINPEDFSEGGILNDVDVEFLKLRFLSGEEAVEQTDSMGTYTDVEETLFVAANLKHQDGDGWEYWSAGKLEYFEPSKDGKRAIPVGNAERLSKSCNAYILLASIIDCGFPRDEFVDDLSVVDGMLAHLFRAEQPKRAGLGGDDGRTRTVLTVDKILDESPVGTGKKGKKASGKAKAEETESGEDFDEIAADTIVKILTDADGGPVKRTSVVGRMLKILKKSHPDDFKAIIQATNEEGFFENLDDVDYDGKELTIGEGED